MKPSFHANSVNKPFEDPCVYVNILREKRALLFDLGYIGRLSPRSLLKVTDIFVTHTHIDHFIGFDIMLRNTLRRAIPLNIYGPANIINCVEGKLRGYTWNLIHDYPLKIEVFEIDNLVVSHASFHARSAFMRKDNPASPFTGLLSSNSLLKIKGIVLCHDIPVMAFSLEEEFHININKAVLTAKGLPVGPWITQLKWSIRNKLPDSTIIKVSEDNFSLGELMEIVTITRGQKISYVMDLAPSDENVAQIIPFIHGSDLLFCEAYFLEEDRARAKERNHLTAALAGRIAREAEVGSLVIMHFSPKYRHCANDLYDEAAKEFKGNNNSPK
ncbi:MAG: ribonuclease Z [Dissulfurispiraceae bacterium]